MRVVAAGTGTAVANFFNQDRGSRAGDMALHDWAEVVYLWLPVKKEIRDKYASKKFADPVLDGRPLFVKHLDSCESNREVIRAVAKQMKDVKVTEGEKKSMKDA